MLQKFWAQLIAVLPDFLKKVPGRIMFCLIIHARSLLSYKLLLSPDKVLDLPEQLWRRKRIALHSDLFVRIGKKRMRREDASESSFC